MKTLIFISLLSLILKAQDNNLSIYNEEESITMYELNENLNTPEAIQEARFIKDLEQRKKNKIKEEEEKKLALEVSKIQKAKKLEEIKKQELESEKKRLQKNFYTKKEVDSLIQKTKQQNSAKTQEILKKEISKTKPEEIIFVKPRTDIPTYEDSLITKVVLPFIRFEFNNNKILIYTEYEMFRNFSIEKNKTLAFDFRGKVSFDLQKGNLESENFKYFAVGNHKDFFRIALRVFEDPSNYSIEYKDKIITITYEKK